MTDSYTSLSLLKYYLLKAAQPVHPTSDLLLSSSLLQPHPLDLVIAFIATSDQLFSLEFYYYKESPLLLCHGE